VNLVVYFGVTVLTWWNLTDRSICIQLRDQFYLKPRKSGLILQSQIKVTNIPFHISGSFLGINAGNSDRFVDVLSCGKILCLYVGINYDRFLSDHNKIKFSMGITMMLAFCISPYEP
jgi:hypothetical protein